MQGVASSLITFFEVIAVKFKEFASFKIGKCNDGLTSHH